ncbi:MAG: choice-of-anchor L domain-containing protein [Bacteroidetes bacterium]|nr:choice-of-anchor L domain-containing protein [Bacteroidota bacterium]
MKKLAILLPCSVWALTMFAQPANDDCSGIVDLGTAPVCPSPAVFTNFNATESSIGNDNLPPCFVGTPERDVWFVFTATAAFTDYTISITQAQGASGPIQQPQVAVYRGECAVDELVLLECASAAPGVNEVSVSLLGLTPGIQYFLRINDWSASAAPNWGDFELCIQEFIDTTFLVNEGGSNLCGGLLYDTGGPGGNYGNNETNVFTICPDQSASGGCIVFTLNNYVIQNGGVDALQFFDGPTVNSPSLAAVAGGAPGGAQSNGGVCYQVVATSGCLTVLFTSNGSLNFAGFEGQWHCTDDCPPPGTLGLAVAPTDADIVSALDNDLVDITVTNVNCNGQSFATFSNGDATELGLDAGLLLTTGNAGQVANPASFFASTNLGLGGDPDLNYLNDVYGNAANTADACVVEMDVFVKTDRLAFDYVMGSDEYKAQFSNASNDLIGILASGPGITGEPGLNGQQNLAFLPVGPNTLVQIQTVNATTNWQYFRNNFNGASIVYNGLTSGFMGQPKSLLAARTVTPCQTYHVKFAIGDTDENDDSGLFVKPSTFGFPVMAASQAGLGYLVEGCVNTPGAVQVSIPDALANASSYLVEIGGTATFGTDYTLNMPSTITFPAGQTTLTFPINPLTDGLAEGTETIVIVLKQDFGCGEVIVSSLTIDLTDALQVSIAPAEDTIFVCQGVNTVQLSASGAVGYSWSPPGIFNNPASASPTATIGSSQVVTVTGTYGTCTATDAVFLQLIAPQIDIIAIGPTQICQGDSVLLNAFNNVNDAGLAWSPTAGLTNPTSAATFANPSATTTYTASVTVTGGCTASDQVTVTVEPFAFPAFVANDTILCQNSGVKLAANVPASSTTFEWTPATGLDNPDIAGATATPDVTTTYTLTATSASGNCVETASVTVTVQPADIDILPDEIKICLGDTTILQALTNTGGVGLTWSPTDSLLVAGAQTVAVFPAVSTWYVATLNTGACIVKDSVLVQVDSLPNLAIEAIPAKAMYCEGEIISLVSPNYSFLGFPDISFQWSPTNGFISEDTLFNVVLNALATTTYVRTTTNNACASMDSITIVVLPVANITVTPATPVICEGESVQLTATADQPIEEWKWLPNVGLSCNDCPNPMASPPGTLTYKVQGDFMGCPVFATVTVTVVETPNYAFPSDKTICPGETTALNTFVDPSAGYVWTLQDGTVVSTEAIPNVSPTQTTTYTLTIDNGQCAPVTDEITIVVRQDFSLILNHDDLTLCQGSEVVLFADAVDAQGNDVPGTAIWSPQGVNGGSVTVNSTTTFVATFTDPGNCFTHTDSFTVSVVQPFLLDSLTATPDTVFEGENIDLQVFTTPVNLDGPTYTWSMNDDIFDETTAPADSLTAPQVDGGSDAVLLAIFKVTVTDEAGCMAMALFSVVVKNSQFEMPNAFSPNNDDLNDRFAPVKSPNNEILDFRIWDRWGQLVYDNEQGNDGWDGKFKEKDMPSDVYVFRIRYTEGGIEKVEKGDVTLLR